MPPGYFWKEKAEGLGEVGNPLGNRLARRADPHLVKHRIPRRWLKVELNSGHTKAARLGDKTCSRVDIATGADLGKKRGLV